MFKIENNYIFFNTHLIISRYTLIGKHRFKVYMKSESSQGRTTMIPTFFQLWELSGNCTFMAYCRKKLLVVYKNAKFI